MLELERIIRRASGSGDARIFNYSVMKLMKLSLGQQRGENKMYKWHSNEESLWSG